MNLNIDVENRRIGRKTQTVELFGELKFPKKHDFVWTHALQHTFIYVPSVRFSHTLFLSLFHQFKATRNYFNWMWFVVVMLVSTAYSLESQNFLSVYYFLPLMRFNSANFETFELHNVITCVLACVFECENLPKMSIEIEIEIERYVLIKHHNTSTKRVVEMWELNSTQLKS